MGRILLVLVLMVGLVLELVLAHLVHRGGSRRRLAQRAGKLLRRARARPLLLLLLARSHELQRRVRGTERGHAHQVVQSRQAQLVLAKWVLRVALASRHSTGTRSPAPVRVRVHGGAVVGERVDPVREDHGRAVGREEVAAGRLAVQGRQTVQVRVGQRRIASGGHTVGNGGDVHVWLDHQFHLALLDNVVAILDERDEKLDQLFDNSALFVVLVAQNGNVAPQRLVVQLDGAQDGL